MLTPILLGRSACLGFALMIAGSSLALAQVPTRASEPRLIPNAQPTAQVPGQPTVATPQAAAAPAAAAPDTTTPLTVVGAPTGGVTQLPMGPAQPTSSTAQAAMAASRSYVAGRYALTLDGANVGSINSIEGGGATAEVVIEKTGSDYFSRKHLAPVKYQDISLTTGLDSRPLTDWIKETVEGRYSRKSGSVVAATQDLKAVSELQFFNGLIREITFPALGGPSKDAASLVLKIAPEYTRLQSASGAKVAGGVDKLAQKRWLASNFRFVMDGLEAGKVSRIESFTFALKVSDDPIGESRDYIKEPGKLDFPDLKLTLAQSYADDWVRWHDDFVIKGNNGQDREKNGAIVYLDPSLKIELARLNLFNCGIFSLAPGKQESNAEKMASLTAELYCERMEFVVSSSKG